MRFLTPILVCLLCIGCRTDRQAQVTPLQPLQFDARRLEGHEDIVEAVFRHMCRPEPVEKEVSHNVNLVHKVFFLAVGDSQDPSLELLKRLDDLKAPVKPISAGEWKDFFIYDRVTGERGAAFYVRGITMRSRVDAEVEAVIHPGGGLSSSGPIYQLRLKSGKWIVVGQRLKWVS